MNGGEAREIGICGDEFATVFHGKSSQMGVGDKIGDGLPLKQHFLKKGPVLLCWMNEPCARLVNPTLHPGEGLIKGQRVFKDARVGADADKRSKDSPREADG